MENKLHKMVELPIGLTVEIRRLDLFEFMAKVGDLPSRILPGVMASFKTEENGQAKESEKSKANIDEQTDMMKQILTTAVVSPKLWFGDEQSLPDGFVYHLDLGAWRWVLMQEIISFSSDSQELDKLTEFFRGAGSVSPGQPGSEVPQDTVGAGDDGTGGTTVQS